MPVVVRRMGGSPTDVAIVVGAPFVGHMLAPFFTMLFAHIPAVRVVAGTSTLARLIFVAGVLVAATPLMLAVTTVFFWIVTVSNVAIYSSLMQGISPGRERGNLMNFAIFPIMLVDHFDAPNTFVGILSAAQSATMVFAYVVVGRLIDRGSSLRQTMIGTVLVLLMPIGYIVAPSYWFLLPLAVVGGLTQASRALTSH